jgi:hypothetical protein
MKGPSIPRNFVHAGCLHVRNVLRTLSHFPGGNDVVAGILDVADETAADVAVLTSGRFRRRLYDGTFTVCSTAY